MFCANVYVKKKILKILKYEDGEMYLIILYNCCSTGRNKRCHISLVLCLITDVYESAHCQTVLEF